MQSVDSTIENALHEFNNSALTADQLQATETNTAQGTAMRGLVDAEGSAQKSLSGAQRVWSRGIATAYRTAATNGALFPVAGNASPASGQVAARGGPG